MCPPGMTRPEGEVLCRRCLWPQFTPDRFICEDCPTRQSPTSVGDACQCANDYYSVRAEPLVCLDDEYDKQVVARANDLALSHGSEVCRVCPMTPAGELCAVCAAGASPTVKAGFRERNELQQGQILRFAFRCGDNRVAGNITDARCPAADIQSDSLVPHGCGKGYEGALCLSCTADFHTREDRCVECEESQTTELSFWVVLATGVGLPLLATCKACRNAYLARKNPDFEQQTVAAYFCPKHINHLRVAMRAGFQPFRIVVTYLLRTMYL